MCPYIDESKDRLTKVGSGHYLEIQDLHSAALAFIRLLCVLKVAESTFVLETCGAPFYMNQHVLYCIV